MTDLLHEVRQEIIDLHDFFVGWFNGTADPDQLDSELIARLDPGMTFVAPEGATLSADTLIGGFRKSFGLNKDFRIQIRDVAVRHVLKDHVLATYTEWQTGSILSKPAKNARQTSVLLTKDKPFKWLHVHETWLPEGVSAAGPYDF